MTPHDFPMPPQWTEQAICAQVDADLWFPEKGADNKPAKRICRRCPVRAECLTDALDTGERYGVWGGTSDRDRRRILGLPDDADAEEGAAA